MIDIIWIAIAVMLLSVIIFIRERKIRITAISFFSLVILNIICSQYIKKGMFFIREQLLPLIITLIIFILVYFILEVIDKKLVKKDM